jgi:general L-amino acid transport system permease protein
MTSPADTADNPTGVAAIWRDERLRGIAIQIGVMLTFFACVFWLVGNVVANFTSLNKSFGFSFLWELPAGYDINQTLIPYTNSDTHLRAAMVGLINTGVVAVMGIFLATLFGFLLGVIRLSNNWLASRLAYWYIEFTRNVPVLLHILLWHGIIINTLPHPRKALALGDSAFLSNRGFYVPRPLFGDTFWITVLAFAAAIAGIVALKRWARQRQIETGRQFPVGWISLAILVGLPLIAFVLTGAPLSFEYPAFKSFNFQGGLYLLPELVALTFALSIYTSAFIAEIVRGGIAAVHKGQREASESLGLRPSKVMSLVILPQALRVIVPPLTSQYLNLTKNSSLAIAIGYMDLVATLGGITLNQTGREMESMILVMLIYLTLSLMIAAFMNWYNRRIEFVER